MNEEYTYNIGKYTVGVDTNGEDGIGLTIAIINDNGEIHFLGNCYGDNARFIDLLIKENKQLKDKLSKIETLIINHNCDTGDIYYKYNSRFLKSELKQRILEILYEEGSDGNEY